MFIVLYRSKEEQPIKNLQRKSRRAKGVKKMKEIKKTVLKKESKFFNPFYVEHGAKTYTLNNILIYDQNGVIVETGCGWFCEMHNTNNKLDGAIIQGETKKINNIKNIDFTKKYNYIVKSPVLGLLKDNEYYLYINKDNVRLNDPILKDNGLYIYYEYYIGSLNINIYKILLFKDNYQVKHQLKELEEVQIYNNNDLINNYDFMLEILRDAKQTAEKQNKIKKMLNTKTYQKMLNNSGYREKQILNNCKNWRYIKTADDHLVIELYKNSDSNLNCEEIGSYDLLTDMWIG